ncbi:hypothetical protein [Pararhodobacter aggregans]
MTDARTLTLALGGRWHGRYGVSPCPICQPERQKGQNALTLADGNSGLLLSCKKAGCSFRDILAAAGVMPGDYAPPDAATIAQREAEQRREAEKRERQARALWAEALPIGGTAAPLLGLPPLFRFALGDGHGSGAHSPRHHARRRQNVAKAQPAFCRTAAGPNCHRQASGRSGLFGAQVGRSSDTP